MSHAFCRPAALDHPGVELVLYFATMKKLLSGRHSRSSQFSTKFFMFFSTAALILITIYQSTETFFGQEMWIVHADYPGGQAAYMAAYANVWYQTMGTAATVVLTAMADGLLVSIVCEIVVWSF